LTSNTEVKTLPCGCKVGKSGEGSWFYNYICNQHVKAVYDKDGHYSFDLQIALIKKLNEELSK
jgi:hypothetical protein